MENNKYYIPELEEFCVGFEYEEEFNNPNWTKMVRPVGDNYEWVKLIMNTSHSISRITSKIKKQKIRVKYLDKSDIESFGFVLKGKSIDLWFEREGIYLRDDGYHLNNIKLQYGLHDQKLKIIFCYVAGEEDTHFEGYIKNKTEFKKLLKQLRIDGNK